MATLSDGFKDIFLAGIGAMAITGEKTKDLVDQLISKGELTVDQGKQINTCLLYTSPSRALACVRCRAPAREIPVHLAGNRVIRGKIAGDALGRVQPAGC